MNPSTPRPAAALPPLPDVTTLLFDIDDTLVPTRRYWQRALDAVAAGVAAAHPGTSAADIATAYARASDRLWAQYDRLLSPLGSLTAIRRHVWGEALREVGIQAPEQTLAAMVDDFAHRQLQAIQPDAELVALFDRLASCYRLGVVTNGDSPTQHAKIQRAGLNGYFETVVCALDVGQRKPRPEPFRQACDELGARPEQCLYIGDDWANDVVGAAAAGLHPVWICADTGPDPAGPRPAARFTTLTCCLNVLAEHAADQPTHETEPT